MAETRRTRIREVNSEGPAVRATAERPPAGFGDSDYGHRDRAGP